MALENLKSKLTALLEPVADELGLFIYDIEVVRGKRLSIRVTAERKTKVDLKDGITIGECAELSRRIDPVIELEQLVIQPYVLQVSSPGLERKLKSIEHFEHAVGECLALVANLAGHGETPLEGRLKAVSAGHIELDQGGEILSIPLEAIRKARTVYLSDR